MTVITRFAPSPTGYLHIGGARTALFNYLFAKHNNGKFLLRIEDTDALRSTEEAKEAILDSLKWLGIDYDGEVIYQSQRYDRHREIAHELIKRGEAYYCFSTQEEIAILREKAQNAGEHFIFNSPWRDKDASAYPTDQKPVIRIKAPRTGEMVVDDLLQGKVTVQNSHLDDMVLLKSDNTPTYMLAVVVDDHDMGITHIIRGDDHLNNASRQQLIYKAMGWDVPKMVHIPLIHGTDGAKLSKRHGALSAAAYKDMGYLPEAINNYLLRLGWAHGNDEIISRKQAVEWFDIKGMGKSPARIDFNKMKHMNAHYLRLMDNEKLAEIIFENLNKNIDAKSQDNIIRGIDAMKPRAELIHDLVELSNIFIVDQEFILHDEVAEIIANCPVNLINETKNALKELSDFNKENIQNTLKIIAANNNLGLGNLMQYIRALITGRINSPSVFEIMEIIGIEEVLKRLEI
ncbi:MAG: glutamate--tRNA ligase [Rickettsiales bacterium]|nr:MAG: glutamate--tRNA ligase [Rickettsiales bacterium]